MISIEKLVKWDRTKCNGCGKTAKYQIEIGDKNKVYVYLCEKCKENIKKI